jgi:intein/homing endonuclease/RecA/RadA recombinase
MKKTAKKTAKSPKQKAKKTQKKTKAKESKSSKSVKSGKTKDAEKPAKPSKATKAKDSEAPAVKTSSKTDKSKMPSVLQSKAYLELMSHMDMQEKKLNIPKVNLDVGGHIENAISTGVLSLDFVLGGGYAGGRFHVVPGREGAGKCVTGDTRILTERGLIEIESLFKESDPWGTPIHRPIKVMTSTGMKTAAEIHRRKASNLVEITGEYTLPLKCTKEHPVLIVDKTTGDLVYREAKYITTGDIMLVKHGTSKSIGSNNTVLGTFNKKKIKPSIELARIIGIILADGNLSSDGVRVSKVHNLCILDKLTADLDYLFGTSHYSIGEYERKSKSGTQVSRRIAVHKELSHFLYSSNILPSCTGARGKYIPSWLFKSDISIVSAFLKAYFTCDYSAEGIASKRLADDLAALLLLVGIPSKSKNKFVKTQTGMHPYTTLTFGAFASDFTSLAHYPGMVGKYRQKLAKVRSVKKSSSKLTQRGVETATDPYRWKSFPWAYDLVNEFKKPLKEHNSGMYHVDGKHQRLRLKFDRNVTGGQFDTNPDYMTSLEKVLPKVAATIKFIRANDLICVRVVTKKDIKGIYPVYDLTVPKVHNFIANGFVVHNSTSIVTSIANATSQNVPSMLTDAEAALDAGYADRALKRFGYSMKKMMGVYDSTKGIWVEPPMVRIQQINNGEKVFRMIRRTMKAMPDIRRDHNGKYWAVTTILNKDGGVKSESAVEHDGMPQFMFYIDSLAALIPDILDSDDEKSTIGAQALMFTRMLPQVCSLITRKNCILVGINQLRDVIGGFSRPGAPTPTTQPGGNALKFYTEVRTAINPCSPTSAGWKNSSDSFEHVEEQSVFGGIDRYKFTKFKNNKHKAFMPNREGYARIRFMHNSRPGDGYDASFDVFHFLESTGQASKRGSTISLDIQPIKANGKNPVLPMEHQAKKVGWMDFKRAVELPENKHAMFNHCRAQIKSGFAFDLERERVTDKKTVAVESEE